MAERKFKLPGIQDLSKEQEDARALPKKGQYLIIGGPGTGKSVLALLRSRRHFEDKDEYVFLVFNQLLKQASHQLFGEELASNQWQSWLGNVFYTMAGKALPKLPPDEKNWQGIDWQKAHEIICALPATEVKDLPYLIIDEGQDMPPDFYKVLANMGFENFFVVADQNQQIAPNENSTRQDIQNVLGIDSAEVFELQNNYRNKLPIARLAREFYTGDPASPPPQLPTSGASSRRPILYEYTEADFQAIIERVLKYADKDQRKLIGVITPNNDVRERYYDLLSKTYVKLDNGRQSVCTFKTRDRHAMSFDSGGIMVINANACKGLEFDTVFLVDIDQYRYFPSNAASFKRLFYVMVARAIDQVIMLKVAGKHCPIESILPTDPDVLERK